MLALDIDDVSVATTSATDTVFLDLVGVRPVLVFLDAFLLVLCGLLEVGDTGELAGRGIGGAMLDGSVTVAEVTEVVNVTGCEESTSSKRVDGSITPLHKTVSTNPDVAEDK